MEKTEKMLVPNFISGYSLKDATKKNEDGICGFQVCNNKLNIEDPKYGYFGIKICDKCGIEVAKNRQNIENEINNYYVGLLQNIAKEYRGVDKC